MRNKLRNRRSGFLSSQAFLVVLLICLIVVRDTPKSLQACCPAFAAGRAIRIADQKILIAWDPVTRTEHFIREAAFKQPSRIQRQDGQDSTTEKSASDFGFLVPSPSQPSIEEADSTVFAQLEEKIQPRIEIKNRWSVDPFPIILSPFALSAAKLSSRMDYDALPPTSAVSVLEIKKVAGYEVAVLKASDATELTKWLTDNDYEVRPNLEEWSKPYVDKGWVITAFKYDTSASRTEVGGVRMSFQTDTPLFPYRVPKDQFADDGARNMLRVFVVGPGRATGSLGEGDQKEAWNLPQLRFSMPVDRQDLLNRIGRALPNQGQDWNATSQAAPSKPTSMWLTAWDDRSWPSSDKDLWFDFDSSADVFQEVRTIVKQRVIPLPIDVLGVLTVCVGLMIRRRWNTSA
ncbi:MAG: hypothetical protein RL069_633 [Planctomycetota bacterium]